MDMIRKLRDILTREEQRRYALLFVAIIGMAGFEVIGVFSVVPFVQLISNPEIVEENRWFAATYDALGFESVNAFLIAVGVAVFTLLAVSNSFRAWTQWFQLRVVWKSAHGIATRLFHRFVQQDYPFFLHNNSNNLAKQVLSEVNQLVTSVLTPLVEFIAQSVVVAAIIGLLVVVDPVVALAVLLTLGGVYAVVYVVTRTYVYRLGTERYAANLERFKSANEALQTIKTVKLAGCEEYFENRFDLANRRFADVTPKYQIISSATRYLVEIIAFGGIIVVVLYLLATGGAIGSALPLLSLYAMAGYRLMPSLQRVFAAASRLRHNQPVIHELHMDFAVRTRVPVRDSANSPAETAEVAFRESIRLDSVSFTYPESEEPVLSDITLTIPKGGSVAFIGSTGSGKTTLVDVISGLLTPTHGSVRVDGHPLHEAQLRPWRAKIGYVPQDVVLYDDSIRRNIAFGIPDDEIDMERVELVARIASIHDFIRDRLPERYEAQVGERGVRLSGGQQQRIGLARALYRNPSVLILDEATSALDGITEEAVISAINRVDQDITTIMIAHRLTTVKNCDRIYLMEEGRIVDQGRFADLMRSNSTVMGMARAGT